MKKKFSENLWREPRSNFTTIYVKVHGMLTLFLGQEIWYTVLQMIFFASPPQIFLYFKFRRVVLVFTVRDKMCSSFLTMYSNFLCYFRLTNLRTQIYFIRNVKINQVMFVINFYFYHVHIISMFLPASFSTICCKVVEEKISLKCFVCS